MSSRRVASSGSTLYLVVAAASLAVTIGGTVLARKSLDDSNTMVVKAREGRAAVKDAQFAKGTDELRALGCKDAAIHDVERVQRLMPKDARNKQQLPDSEMPKFLVQCEIGEKGPSCEDVAQRYLQNATGKGRFAVVVVSSAGEGGQPRALCDRMYEGDGTPVLDKLLPNHAPNQDKAPTDKAQDGPRDFERPSRDLREREPEPKVAPESSALPKVRP